MDSSGRSCLAHSIALTHEGAVMYRYLNLGTLRGKGNVGAVGAVGAAV